MPLITAAASLPVIASLIWAGVIAAIVNRPESSDLYACLGAGLASICALIEARGNGRSVGETIRVFIGSAAAGVFGPGMLHGFVKWKGWLSVETEVFLTWQWWAASGFFFALNGWGVLHLVNAALQKRAQKLLRDWHLANEETQRLDPPKPNTQP